MKIAIVVKHSSLIVNFIETAARLLERGHRVLFFCHDEPHPDVFITKNPVFKTPGYVKHPWGYELYKAVCDYQPDVVWTWNGNFVWLIPFFHALQSRFRVLISELAWLPQSGNNFIDELGGNLQMGRPEPIKPKSIPLDMVRGLYPTVQSDQSLPPDFVFVPMQLEYDTSILYRSPHVKTMDQLLMMTRMLYPHSPIICKNHPREAGILRQGHGVLQYTGPKSSLELAVLSSTVVGINSTILIEALLWNKKVVCFGQNPALDVMQDGMSLLQGTTKNIDQTATEARLSYLVRAQYHYQNPPDWLLNFIEGKGPNYNGN